MQDSSMRFLGSLYLFAGYYSTIALAPAAAQQPAVPPAAASTPLDPSASPESAHANPGQVPADKPAAAAAAPRKARTSPSAPPGSAAPPTGDGAPPSPGGEAAATGVSAQVTSAAGGEPPAAAAATGVSAPVASTAGGEPAPHAPGEGARLAKQHGVAVAPSHDAERPPVPPEPEGPSDTGFAARLSLGVGGALWISGGDTKLSRPFWFGLDLGYALTRNLTLFARATSWFPYDNLANEFFGVGAAYRFVAERVYVAPALGASFTRQGSASEWSHYFQGLALEADVGQYFPLAGSTSFSFGAHFQVGTPLFGKKPDAYTSLQAGIFVALGLH